MLPPLLMAASFALFILAGDNVAASPSTRERFEQMAVELIYFSPDQFVFGQTAPLAPDQGRIQKDLPVISNRREAQRLFEISRGIVRELSWHEWKAAELIALLEHPNAKVRTLAAAALFATDDSQNILPLAKLLTDDAQTFPSASTDMLAMSGIGGSCLRSQTVREVTVRLVRPYVTGSPLGFSTRRPGGDPLVEFQEAWMLREGHAITCRDFSVWRWRAFGEDTDTNEETTARLNRIRDRLKQVPMPDQAWYAMAIGGSFSHGRRHFELLPDDDIVNLAQKLGHEKLMRALARDIETTDPTLRPADPDKPRSILSGIEFFYSVRYFILEHAQKLLTPQDADKLLAIAAKEGTPVSLWASAAASLQADRAIEIYRSALASPVGPNSFGYGGTLAAALWQKGGNSQTDFIVDWFYRQVAAPTGWNNPMESFLVKIDKTAEPDGRQLIARIIADPRLSKLNWVNTKTLIGIINGRLADPWCDKDEFAALGGPFPMSIADSFLRDREKSLREHPEELRKVEETIEFWQSQMRKRIDEYYPLGGK